MEGHRKSIPCLHGAISHSNNRSKRVHNTTCNCRHLQIPVHSFRCCHICSSKRNAHVIVTNKGLRECNDGIWRNSSRPNCSFQLTQVVMHSTCMMRSTRIWFQIMTCWALMGLWLVDYVDKQSALRGSSRIPWDLCLVRECKSTRDSFVTLTLHLAKQLATWSTGFTLSLSHFPIQLLPIRHTLFMSKHMSKECTCFGI